jgi:hypothetical protein
MVGLVVAGLTLAIAGSADAQNRPDPSGTWKWAVGVGTQGVPMTLHLKREGDQLLGVISGKRFPDTAIESVSFVDGKLSFNVPREARGRKILTKYYGRINGDVIEGKIELPGRGGQKEILDWSAKRVRE